MRPAGWRCNPTGTTCLLNKRDKNVAHPAGSGIEISVLRQVGDGTTPRSRDPVEIFPHPSIDKKGENTRKKERKTERSTFNIERRSRWLGVLRRRQRRRRWPYAVAVRRIGRSRRSRRNRGTLGPSWNTIGVGHIGPVAVNRCGRSCAPLSLNKQWSLSFNCYQLAN